MTKPGIIHGVEHGVLFKGAIHNTLEHLRAQVMFYDAAQTALIREVKPGHVNILCVADPIPDNTYRETVDRRVQADRPAGVLITVAWCTPAELMAALEEQDAYVKVLEAQVLRYEELAPDLRAADAALETIKHDDDLDAPFLKNQQGGVIEVPQTIDQRRAIGGLPPLPGGQGQVLIDQHWIGRNAPALEASFIETHENAQRLGEMIATGRTTLDGEKEPGE